MDRLTLSAALILASALGAWSAETRREAKQRIAEESSKDAQAALPRLLNAGRYRCVVKGILCEACKRAILRELKPIKELQSAKFEPDEPVLWLSVAKGKTVRLSRLNRAMRFATEKIALGNELVLVEIRYSP
ncbi:MAG TPA: hypothetical protein DCM05_00200 [Elusimicrobia bacterium]|nr:hypothetical protein [Elusimicrobiota bacterium]